MKRVPFSDHILFDECIDVFRPVERSTDLMKDGPGFSYIVTSFEIHKEWKLPNCTIHPSECYLISDENVAFICKVDNPVECDAHNAHLFGNALASIMTFATGRLCKSTRNDYSLAGIDPPEQVIMDISLANPTSTTNCSYALSDATLQKHHDDVAHIIKKLNEIHHSDYVILMQAIRLVHLSISYKKEDFGLAYLLAISAIESVAQHAIELGKERRRNPKEKLWKKLVAGNDDLIELLNSYTDARSQNKFIKERYIEFINAFAPSQEWGRITRHHMQDSDDYILEQTGRPPITSRRRIPLEVYPEDLTAEQVERILSQSYAHRSSFIHRGKQPPHKHPNPYTRYFQTFISYKNGTYNSELIPNHELIIGIALCSMRGWMNSL